MPFFSKGNSIYLKKNSDFRIALRFFLKIIYYIIGIRDYGFVPLDPLKVPKMDIGQDTGPVTLKLELIDTTHTGMGTLKFNTAKYVSNIYQKLKRNQ